MTAYAYEIGQYIKANQNGSDYVGKVIDTGMVYIQVDCTDGNVRWFDIRAAVERLATTDEIMMHLFTK